MELIGFGEIKKDSGFIPLRKCSDNIFKAGENGVHAIFSTGDSKVELIGFEKQTIAYVKSEMGFPAYYPVRPVKKEKPIKAVLMDLDGTTVTSEAFWMWIIELSVADLMKNSSFKLKEKDIPYVSGHSVSEHLKYCIGKYCKDKTVDEAREIYFKHTAKQLQLIAQGRGKQGAFTMNNGVKEFLLELKNKNIKIGLVTSGLYEKAYPEIKSAFETMDMGDPKEFYDCIITAGYPLKKGSTGTLGELEIKPHPWLYAETCRIGLGIEDADTVMGIEDSGAGVCSVRLAGYTTVGIANGNIINSGTKGMCHAYCNTFDEILKLIGDRT